ncbi:hypothetical protein [Catenovulum maritimum]|uniref:hypothetical protein n=1 Tax=Catenovulum maritimum TaxID=1513271 RepID=UPI0012B52771|nr:hypothetical protein [Catenovulum maritimum]
MTWQYFYLASQSRASSSIYSSEQTVPSLGYLPDLASSLVTPKSGQYDSPHTHSD